MKCKEESSTMVLFGAWGLLLGICRPRLRLLMEAIFVLLQLNVNSTQVDSGANLPMCYLSLA